MTPRARSEDLLVQEVGDEVVVYDRRRHRAHRLNAAATVVWRGCDGRTGLPELAAALHDRLGVPADERVVTLALDRLDRAQLVSGYEPATGRRLSRRAVMRDAGIGGALALLLPVVTSLNSPAGAQALSPTPGGTCNCIVERQPPNPTQSCSSSNNGATTTTSSTGNCMGTRTNCTGACTLTATWECQGSTGTWLQTGRSNNCPT